MIELSRGLSFVVYTYEGGPLRFNVPFPFILREHVRVLVGEPSAARTVSPKWINDSTVEIPSQSDILDAPYTVTVRRITPTAAPLVNFADGAMLPAKQLNTAVRQLLYAQQEFSEYFGGGTPPAGGTPGGGGADIDAIISSLIQSNNMQTLLGAIPRIDSDSETLLQELLRSNDLNDETRLSRARLTGAETRLITVETEAANIAAQYTELFARMVTAEGDIEANYQQLNAAVATEASARATAITSLQATLGGTVAQVEERLEALVTGAPDPSATPMWSANWSIRLAASPVGGQPVIAGIGLGIDSVTGSSFIVMADKFAIVHPTYTAGGALAALKFPFVVGTVGGLSTVGINGALAVDGSITADKLTVNSLAAITANAGTINGGTFKTHTLDSSGAVIDSTEFRVEMSNVGTWPLWIGSGVKNENNAVFWIDRLGNAAFKGKVSAPNIVGQFQQATAVTWTGAVTLPYRAAGINQPQASFTTITSFTLAAPLLVGEAHTPSLSLNVSHDSVPGAEFILEELRTSVWVEIARAGASRIVSGYGNTIGESYNWYETVSSLYTTNTTLTAVGEATTTARQFRVRGRYDCGWWRDEFNRLSSLGETVSTHRALAVTGYVFGIR